MKRRALKRRYGRAMKADTWERKARAELSAMYFSGSHDPRSQERASNFYESHTQEFSRARESAESPTKAARRIGGRHGIFHFRGR
jgi:hypothetical protein